nr:uncharacterized protein c8e11.05c [Quercus suber]
MDSSSNDTALGQDEQQAWFRSMWNGKGEDAAEIRHDETDNADDENDDFGDDFDDFAEEGGEDDFGDFDKAEDTAAEAPQEPPSQPPTPAPLAGLPPLDFSDPSSDSGLDAYLSAIFPDSIQPPSHVELPKASAFLSDRSLSLWQQLVSPPPMAPPNWTRSRIRRLFLVSLGVPVDLDEILPPSKQKRLILPNINLPTSPRPSTALDRLRQEDGLGTSNSSTTSLDSRGATKRPSAAKRTGTLRGPPPPPDFDLNAATLLCSTTSQAMQGLADDALQHHVLSLEDLNQRASGVLEHWLERKDEAVKEKEALEGVIENLVGFVKGRRGKFCKPLAITVEDEDMTSRKIVLECFKMVTFSFRITYRWVTLSYKTYLKI